MFETLTAHAALVRLQAERDSLTPLAQALTAFLAAHVLALPWPIALQLGQLLDDLNREIADDERTVGNLLPGALAALVTCQGGSDA